MIKFCWGPDQLSPMKDNYPPVLLLGGSTLHMSISWGNFVSMNVILNISFIFSFPYKELSESRLLCKTIRDSGQIETIMAVVYTVVSVLILHKKRSHSDQSKSLVKLYSA